MPVLAVAIRWKRAKYPPENVNLSDTRFDISGADIMISFGMGSAWLGLRATRDLRTNGQGIFDAHCCSGLVIDRQLSRDGWWYDSLSTIFCER
jgi:hypothetical protein